MVSFTIVGVLLLLLSVAASVLVALLIGYICLKLVFQLISHWTGAASGPAINGARPVRSQPPQDLPPQMAQAVMNRSGSMARSFGTLVLLVLGLAVGLLPAFLFSSRVVQAPPPQPVPVVDGSSLPSDFLQLQTGNRIQIPVDPRPALADGRSSGGGQTAEPVSGSGASDVAAAVAAGPSSGQPSETDRNQLREVASQLGQLFRSQLEGPAEAAESAGAAGESADGDVVVYQFSEQMLADLFGSNAVDTLRSISQQMPSGIRNSYALIPLPGSVGATVPPMRPLLASSGLRSLADSLVELLKSGTSTAQQATTVAGQPGAVQPPTPAWVRKPAPDSRVARAEVLPGEQLEEKVRESIAELLTAELHSQAGWIPEQLRRPASTTVVELNAESVRQIVQNRFERTETLDVPVAGADHLRVVWTEVKLPKQQLLQQLSATAARNRGLLLGILVFTVWSILVLMAFTVRLWAGGGMISRTVSLATGTVSLLLLAACIAGPVAASQNRLPRELNIAAGSLAWSIGPETDRITLSL